MSENNRNPIEKCRKKLSQFTTMNVMDGQASLVIYASLIFYSLTIDNILNIIVLLILAGVTIAMLTGENGILAQASKAKIETRGASVQEARDLWFTDKKLKTAKSLDEVLNELKEQSLLTDKEIAEIKETGQVTIGSRTIVFGKEQNVELAARVIYNDHNKQYSILVGFKKYQVNSDLPKNVTDTTVKEYLRNCTEKDKENIFVEIYNLQNNTNISKASEIFKIAYEQKETNKLCTTLDEFALDVGYENADEFLVTAGDEVFWEGKIGEVGHITGELIDPSGNKSTLSTFNMNAGKYGDYLFESYAYKYEITKNGSYTFNFMSNNGQAESITIVIDENHPCIVLSDNMCNMTIMNGIDNFVTPERARAENVIYREGETGPENFDMTEFIENIRNFPEGTKGLSLLLGYFDANIILTYKGKEYSIRLDSVIAK